ncbi:MAG: alcohol dehydrogenase catalytic domain-containing protein [Patescibacteria group bacterium]
MQALVFEGKGKLNLRHLPRPEIGPNEILMRVRAVGICGTDLHIYNGGTRTKPGTVIGHEFSGEVAAVGKAVDNLTVGDHIVGEHVVACKQCLYCRTGRPNLCNRASVLGIDRNGALAEYVAIPADLVYIVPKKIPFEEAALIEPLSIAVYAAREVGFLLEKRVGVIGQGPIGLFLDQVMHAAGAQVIGIDTLDHRLRFAKKQGWVDYTINPKTDDVQRSVDAITKHGLDIAFEAVGKEQTMDLALQVVRRGAKVLVLGVFETPAKIDMMQVVKKELSLVGSWTCAHAFPASIRLVEEEKVELGKLITHRYLFTEAARAFAEASTYNENRIKSVITFE